MTTTPAPGATSPEIPDPDPNSRYERACRRFLEVRGSVGTAIRVDVSALRAWFETWEEARP